MGNKTYNMNSNCQRQSFNHQSIRVLKECLTVEEFID